MPTIAAVSGTVEFSCTGVLCDAWTVGLETSGGGVSCVVVDIEASISWFFNGWSVCFGASEGFVSCLMEPAMVEVSETVGPSGVLFDVSTVGAVCLGTSAGGVPSVVVLARAVLSRTVWFSDVLFGGLLGKSGGSVPCLVISGTNGWTIRVGTSGGGVPCVVVSGFSWA